jgi:cytochrome P450
VLTTHADITFAAADPRFSAQGGGGRAGGGSHLDDLALGVHAGVFLPMMDNPRHDLFKRLLRPSVTGSLAQALAPEFSAIAAALVDAAVGAGQVDLVDEVVEPYAVQAIARLLGIRRADWPRLVEWCHGIVGFTDRRTGVVTEPARDTFAAIQTYGRDLLLHQRHTPEPGLTSVLAHGRIDDVELTDTERELNFNLFLLTGSEQPRNTIAGGLIAFAEHPDQWQALRHNRDLLPGAVEEMLRWAPPNPYNRRTATTNLRLGGERIQAGDKVTLWWPSANRDEAVFPAADTFDIRRTHNPHVTFGSGTHCCLGDQVARLEIRLLLEQLLDRVEAIHLTGPVTWAPSNKHTVVLDLPVELVPATDAKEVTR